MQTLTPIIIVGGGALIALISAAITAAHYRRRMTGLYNRGWLAGKSFQRQFPEN